MVDGVSEKKPRIIKQNYQDDSRPHEGSFYAEANEIEGLGRLNSSQASDSTREYHKQIPADKVQGCWRKSTPPPPKKVRDLAAQPAIDYDQLMDSMLPRARKAPTLPAVKDLKPASRKTGGSGPTTSTSGMFSGSALKPPSAGTWKLHPTEKCHSGAERVLLRFVFDDYAGPLCFAADGKELIRIVRDHLNGMSSKPAPLVGL